MSAKLAGFQMAPSERFHKDLSDYVQRLANGGALGEPPLAATPVFTDEQGESFAGLPSERGVMGLGFVPGSGTAGGAPFLAADRGGGSGGDDDMTRLLGAMARSAPAADTANWLSKAAATGMLAGAPGTGLAAALKTLGLDNPMARGALGGAISAAASAAGLGPAGNLLGAVMQAAGLGGNAGLGALAGAVAGQLPGLAGLLAGGGWGGNLAQAAGAIQGAVGKAGANLPGDLVDPAGNKGFNPGAVATKALDEAADKLLEQWKVDDESSAGEQVAHKLVTDNKDALKEAAQDPNAFIKKIKAFFQGASSPATLQAARIGDPDVKKPDMLVMGVPSILVQNVPVSRRTDVLGPSGAAVLVGATSVLSAGLDTARMTSKTSAPDVMIEKGAPQVLVGDLNAPAPPPDKASDPKNKGNSGPKNPDAPKKGGTGSGPGAGGATGAGQQTPGGDATPGQVVADDYKGKPHDGYSDIMGLPVEDPPDPHGPMADHAFRFVDPETNEWRAWDPALGMSATPSESPSLTLPDWGLMVAKPGEKDWFGNDYKAGNWYLLGGLIDLGSPVWPGAGSGGVWYIPDKILGNDMSNYYIPHDWMFHPSASHSALGDIIPEWELPAFLAGLEGNKSLTRTGLQVIYSSATTLISLGEWLTSKHA